MTQKSAAHYLAYNLPELRRMLARAEDRATRAPTMEAALSDEYACQEIGRAIAIKEAREGTLP